MTEQEHEKNKAAYREYLHSDRWRELKNKRLKIDSYRCQCCHRAGTQENPLEVHHITYPRAGKYGTENVYIDLVTLCHNCHKGVHNMMNRTTGYEADGTPKRGWIYSLDPVKVDMEHEPITFQIVIDYRDHAKDLRLTVNVPELEALADHSKRHNAI